MCPPRFYADFNGIEYLDADQSHAVLELAGYGALASLGEQKLRLTEGMAVVIYEPDDIEADAVVRFDRARTDPAGRTGAWVAHLDARKIRTCAEGTAMPETHPCFGGGRDLKPHFRIVGQRYNEHCPDCGTDVMSPMLPPSDAT
jgi:hypothetical protein